MQQFCGIDEAGKNLIRIAVRQMDLSARSYHRVLKLARAIADLGGEEAIAVQHLAGALQYRPRGVVLVRGRSSLAVLLAGTVVSE